MSPHCKTNCTNHYLGGKMTKEDENKIVEELAGLYDIVQDINIKLEAFANVPTDTPDHIVRAMLEEYEKPRH